MTDKQRETYNRMRLALRKNHLGFQSTSQLRRNCDRDYGIDYMEALEMAYENMQSVAEQAVYRVCEIREADHA